MGRRQLGKTRTNVTAFGQAGEDRRGRVLNFGVGAQASCAVFFGAVKQIWVLEPETGAQHFCAAKKLKRLKYNAR
jgi:hypothetical protein